LKITPNGTSSLLLVLTALFALQHAHASDLIAFYSQRDGNSEIYSVRADGSGMTRLTNHPSNDTCPAWSPDGRTLAFSSDRSGRNEIYLMNADGGSPVRLTDSDMEKLQPDWSHDGRHIAFRGQANEDSEIFVMKSNGSDITQLTHNSIDEERPVWSPDGEQILFSSKGASGSYDLQLMNVDGSGRRSLTDSANSHEIFADWSPDGKSIVYFANPDGDRDFDLFLLSLPEGSVQRIVNTNFVDEDPLFSVGGELIAFQSNRDGNYEIYVVDADGRNPRNVSNDPAGDYWPSWKEE
jgi:TolB protein